MNKEEEKLGLSDVPPAFYLEFVRGLSEEQRFLLGLWSTNQFRQQIIHLIKKKEPDLQGGDLKARFFDLMYGHEFPEGRKTEIISRIKQNH